MTRRQGWRGAVLLGAFVLGLAGAAASALGAEDCCRDMHETARGSCESIAPSACCGGPEAVHATTPTPAVPKSLAAAPAVDPAATPGFALRGAGEAPRVRAETLLIRSVVLRL